jgi:hypothetical protein
LLGLRSFRNLRLWVMIALGKVPTLFGTAQI